MSLLFAGFLIWLLGGICAGFLLLVADWLLERRDHKRQMRRAGEISDAVFLTFREPFIEWQREMSRRGLQ